MQNNLAPTIKIDDIKKALKKEAIEFEFIINNPAIQITKLAYIYNASENSLAYYTGEDSKQFKLNALSLVCEAQTDQSNKDINYIIVEDAKIAFYVIAQLFKKNNYPEGIHPSASIGQNVEIKPGVHVGANCVIEDDVTIGENATLHPNTVIYSRTVIGKNTTIEANCSIGAAGLFWTWDKKGKMWQLPFRGGVSIEDNCFLGTDISVVRGCFDDDVTVIGSKTKIAHGTKIGHDCQIGQSNHIANNVTLGGKVVLEDRCFLGSGCVVKPGCSLGEDYIVGAGAVVTKNYNDERLILVGNPAKPMKTKNQRPSGMHAPYYMVKD